MTTELNRTRQQLLEIPALAIACGLFLVPGRGASNDGPRPAPSSRPPIDVGVLDLVEGRELWAWIMLCVDEWEDLGRDLDDTPDARNPTITAMCEWLSSEAGFIADNHPDFPDSIANLYGQYRHAAGDPETATYHCPDCGWIVEPRDDMAWWNCTGCPRTWTLGAEISRLMERQQDVMTLGQISQRLGIPHPTLRRWAGKRFVSVGTKHGRPLYDIRTVRAATERLRDTA